MLLCINYADEKFRPWQQLQTQTAYRFGADKVREYSPKDIPADFYAKNKFILDQPRGAGYWLWKPLIIKDALSNVDEGDYVFYADSGAFYINYTPPLIDIMQKLNIYVMPFVATQNLLPLTYERIWNKRDAFILMDCDNEQTANSLQIMATFILVRKTADSVALIDEFLEYAQDPRILTDIPNQLGKENYDGFKEHRHDQSVWSLLIKKRGIQPFRDPSHFFELVPRENFPKDVLDRSNYPTMFYLHRRSVGFNRTIEDFLRIYANEPRLCEGIRTAKYLLQEGMVKEAYEVLWRLYQKYRDDSDEAWLSIWDDLMYIIFKHNRLGSPYAETFRPLMFKLLLQVVRRRVDLHQITQLIFAVSIVEDKNLIPKDFQEALAYLVAGYVKQMTGAKIPAFMSTAQEMLTAYRELKMPIPL